MKTEKQLKGTRGNQITLLDYITYLRVKAQIEGNIPFVLQLLETETHLSMCNDEYEELNLSEFTTEHLLALLGWTDEEAGEDVSEELFETLGSIYDHATVEGIITNQDNPLLNHEMRRK